MSDEAVIAVQTHTRAIVAAVQPVELDDDGTDQVKRQVAAAAAEARSIPNVILDLANVGMLPSLSLGALVTLMKELKASDQRLILAGVQAPVREALAITRLDRLFEMHDDVDSALARLGGL